MSNSPFRPLVAAAALALVALPLAAQSSSAGAKSAKDAVEEFMRAAADSNLARMGQLFGTDKGSAAATGNPADYPKRMVVMQAALHGIRVKAHAETPMGKKNHVLVTTELARGACKVTVPVTAVKAKNGWLVREFDLNAIWEGINRPCEGTGSDGNTGGAPGVQ